jgi:hypothetical protein
MPSPKIVTDETIGLPGGVAGLDADGDVVDSSGRKVKPSIVGGGGLTVVEEGDGTVSITVQQGSSSTIVDNGDGTVSLTI